MKLSEAKKSNEELERKVKFLEKQNQIFKGNNEVLQGECTHYKTIIEQRNKEIRSLFIRFREPEELYNTYLGLSDTTRGSLKGIFKGNTVEDFVFCGVQLENIESLWEFIKREVIENRLCELENLKKIFAYFFKAYNSVYDSPIYQMLDIKIGENFDEDKHMRSSNSRVTGSINEILLQGYIITKTGKVAKKTIVII